MRVRPWSEREKQHNVVPVVSALSSQKEVSVIKEVYGRSTTKKHVFHFDDVFTNFTTQEEVFATTLAPMISDVMQGFESTGAMPHIFFDSQSSPKCLIPPPRPCMRTVFAYGQTGTGKTYTMEGDPDSEEHQGVIPRAVRDIFERLRSPRYKARSATSAK